MPRARHAGAARDDGGVPSDLGAWEPFDVETVAALMGPTDVLWWLSGGEALDRFVGRVTRAHGDIDVSVRRADLPRLVTRLTGRLELVIARGGQLFDLDPNAADESVHGLWARLPGGGPWRVQINLEPCAGDEWVYRRDPRVRRPLTEVIADLAGVPCVNPAVQLLWKAADPRPQDELDLATVLPLLAPADRAWLAVAIGTARPGSPWRDRVPPI